MSVYFKILPEIYFSTLELTDCGRCFSSLSSSSSNISSCLGERFRWGSVSGCFEGSGVCVCVCGSYWRWGRFFTGEGLSLHTFFPWQRGMGGEVLLLWLCPTMCIPESENTHTHIHTRTHTHLTDTAETSYWPFQSSQIRLLDSRTDAGDFIILLFTIIKKRGAVSEESGWRMWAAELWLQRSRLFHGKFFGSGGRENPQVFPRPCRLLYTDPNLYLNPSFLFFQFFECSFWAVIPVLGGSLDDEWVPSGFCKDRRESAA